MSEQLWRKITGFAGIVVGLLALCVLFEHLRGLIDPIAAAVAPFLLAFLIAFLLNPLLARLESKGLSRIFAVTITSLMFLAAFAAIVFLILPKLVEQGVDLARRLPDYARSLENGIDRFLAGQETILRRVSLPTSVSGLLKRFPDQVRGFSTSALGLVSHFLLAAIGKITWVVIVPLLTVWFLINWESQKAGIYRLVPDAYKERLRHVSASVAAVLNSYVRGAIIVGVLYGIVTTLILGLIFRMPYALVLGLIAGLVSPIPYIGSVVILLSTGIVAYATNPSLGYTLAVLGAMIVQNNVLFDNLIAPRVLGGSVGLNLPWSIFALMLGGALLGIAGMIIAVPVGATIRVLALEFLPKRTEETSESSHSPEEGAPHLALPTQHD
ncbi:MAG: AI-2E family transporter [Armatimonadota bacterium]|jgi:predicted PurR-regulated permease PerM